MKLKFAGSYIVFLALITPAVGYGQYPLTELLNHRSLHGSAQEVSTKDLNIVILRALLTLDLIDTNPQNRQLHIDAFSTHLLPKLRIATVGVDTLSTTLISSLEFRFNQLLFPQSHVDRSGGGQTGGGSSSVFQNSSVTSVDDCDKFDSGFRNYCDNPAFQTFIVAEVAGGNSTNYSNLELFLRTADWNKYQSQSDLNAALEGAGISPDVVTQFSVEFLTTNSDSSLFQKFQLEENLIRENPRFYMLQNIGDAEVLQQLSNPAFQPR